MSNKKNETVIIKRYDEAGGHAHHGGGWKVAYADFMTAMMAFFLLLWILAASDEEKLRGLANYFTPTLSDGGAASDAAADLRPLTAPGVMTGGVENTGSIKAPSFGRDNPMMVFDSRLRDRPAEVIVEYADEPEPSKTPDPAKAEDPSNPADVLAAQEADTRRREIDRMAEEIADRITSDAGLRDLARNVRLEKSDGALTVQVLDQDERSLFETRKLLEAIGGVIASQSEPVEIVGHTDAATYDAATGYSNWELSADRANATRRMLMEAGISSARFMRISGVADTQPINTMDLFAPENRRISIKLLYQAE